MSSWRNVVLLSGGVGGARFADGVAAALDPEALTIVVNTGDDFMHWGLHIAPDLDTVMYTLSGLAHEARGWGLAQESFAALSMIDHYGGPAWFQLGDRDLATHILRSEALAEGQTLTHITSRLCAGLGVEPRVLPMADQLRRTLVDTTDGRTLSFQDWLVLERASPTPATVRFEGGSTPAPAALEAIEQADLVLVGPSNPYVSIEPITSLDGIADALTHKLVVGVSPIVGGRAVKGPLAEMIPALDGEPATAAAVARRYAPWLDAWVVDPADDEDIEVRTFTTDVIMRDRADRKRLAQEVLEFAATLHGGPA